MQGHAQRAPVGSLEALLCAGYLFKNVYRGSTQQVIAKGKHGMLNQDGSETMLRVRQFTRCLEINTMLRSLLPKHRHCFISNAAVLPQGLQVPFLAGTCSRLIQSGCSFKKKDARLASSGCWFGPSA